MAVPKPRTAEFDVGFQRGEAFITSVTLRKPMGGALRGLSNIDVVRQEYNAIVKLAPRITEPPMTEVDVASLEPADLMTLGTEIAAFFLTRKDRAEAGLTD